MSGCLLTEDAGGCLPKDGIYIINSFLLGERYKDHEGRLCIDFLESQVYTFDGALGMFARNIFTRPNLDIFPAQDVFDLADPAQREALETALDKSNAEILGTYK